VESEVLENSGHDLLIRIINDDPIGSGKKVTIQGYRVKLPFLTDRDKADILFAILLEIYAVGDILFGR
jgi:pyruvate kinase